MDPLNPNQFPEFFRAVHGHEPFDWQKRLAKEVLEDGWPDVIRVPTACGKTAVLDIAVFELAIQADHQPSQRTAARRICFVIDRRLVVDEIADTELDPNTKKARGHAIRLRNAIHAAAAGTDVDAALKAVAGRIKELAADTSDPLRVVRLRGGVYRDDGWAADPLTPTVLISTVDQIGSRLLFRGYGVGTRSRPVHAGLLAFDTRIILDEAHLSAIFGHAVADLQRYQGRAERPPLPAARLVNIVAMSATAKPAGRVFELLDQERKDIRLSPRLVASKPAELVSVQVEAIPKQMREQQPRTARQHEHQNRDKFVRKVVEQAESPAFSGDGTPSPQVVGIVVNRVATARSAFELLRAQKEEGLGRDAILLTGRIRPYDRDRLLNNWLPWMRAGRQTKIDRPLFVVATQTVEVGANLDFDALVTEAAPLAALRQRFGRLDRLGARNKSHAAVVIRSDHAGSAHDDPIYGKAIGATWKWLSKTKHVDFGINHLDSKLKKVRLEDLAAMETKAPDVPLMFPAHLDAWVQTDPLPEPDPDVAPFLHGRADTAADVQVVWRADLRLDNKESWRAIVSLIPPRSREALPVPIYEAQRWLRNEAAGEIADIEGPAIETESRGKAEMRQVLRWRGSTERATTVIDDPEDVRPGDTIIVPSSYGGSDAFGWNPGSHAPVQDVADECLTQIIASYPKGAFRRPRLRLRLHPALLPACEPAVRGHLESLLINAISAVQEEREDAWHLVCRLLRASRTHLQDPERIAAIDALLEIESPQLYTYPKRDGLVVVAQASVSLGTAAVAAPEDLDSDDSMEEETSVVSKGRRVELSVHTSAVQEMSVTFAKRSGFHENWAEQLMEAIRTAGGWHDQGKRDQRFQAWLHGSDIDALVALASDQVLAKSGRDSKEWQSSEVFGYPRGSRHEFVSVRLFEETLDAGASDMKLDSDLTKLLIGTHHGHGRAFAPVVRDPKPVDVVLTHNGRKITVSSDHLIYRLDSGWTDLFWRMVRRYGWWGLAYLEALLVTADRAVSAREQRPEDHTEAVAT